jgi:hypothetical protein
MEPIKPDFTIVYEKYTEEAATFLSGSLANKYTCKVLKDTVFESNKNIYTNNNRILFLSEVLIGTYLGMGEKTEYAIDANWGDDKIVVYTTLSSLGNWRSLWVDIDKTLNTLPKDAVSSYKQFVYGGDFLLYPLLRKQGKPSKITFDRYFYNCAVGFFLKDENIKLIIPD